MVARRVHPARDLAACRPQKNGVVSSGFHAPIIYSVLSSRYREERNLGKGFSRQNGDLPPVAPYTSPLT